MNSKSIGSSSTIGRARIAGVTLVMLLFGAGSCARAMSAQASARILTFGPGDMRALSVHLEPGATVDVQPDFEVEWFHIVHPDRRRYRYMQVGVVASDVKFRFETATRPICISGLRGLTASEGSSRTVVLQMPPDLTGLYSVIFGFDDRDRDSWSVLRSIAIKGRHGSC